MNFPRPTPEQINAFAKRSISGLPDSLAAQRDDLIVLVKILPHATPGRRAAKEMLAALLLRDQAQQEFCFTNGGQA